MLNEAPRDRAADLAALVAARHEAARDVIDRRLDVAKLECRTRPWRERRQPDHEPMRAHHRLDEGERRIERFDHEIAGLEASQHRRASHLAPHSADAVELAEIDRWLAAELPPERRRELASVGAEKTPRELQALVHEVAARHLDLTD